MSGFTIKNFDAIDNAAADDIVTAGSGRARLDDEIVDIGAWDVIRVAPGVVRGFEAGADGLELVAVGSDRPEGGDGVIAKDWWTD